MVNTQEHTGLVPVADVARLSGLEFFQAIAAGDLPHPPMTGAIPMQVTQVETGRIIWTTRAPDWFINPLGQVHGGFAMTILDSALGCSVHSALPAGRGYTTVEAKVNMTRPIPLGEDLTCEGKMITLGNRIGTSEARLMDAKGRILGFGTSTCLIFDI